MDLGTFFSADNDVVAAIVGHHAPMSCVLAVNGTRRWFALEHEHGGDYRAAIHTQYRRLARLFFDHGVDNLVLPVFGPALAARPEYVQEAARGVAALCSDEWNRFYTRHRARVCFYGSGRRAFDAALQAEMDDVEECTQKRSRRRLCFGLGAGPGGDAAEIAHLAVQHRAESDRTPDRDELVGLYYGQPMPPARMFVGFGPPCAFDFPLLDDGDCALYFTAAPTPYLNRNTLRAILYDFVYSRREREGYGDLPAQERDSLRRFYSLNQGVVCGVGSAGPGGVWSPLSNLMYPDDFWRSGR